MPSDDSVYVGHMLDMSKKATRLAQGKDRAEFDRDEALQLALAHLIQIIGEAARRVSPEFRDAHPQIPWRAIVGMRHKIVHDYMDVDEDIVWDTVRHELLPLVTQLEAAIAPDNSVNNDSDRIHE